MTDLLDVASVGFAYDREPVLDQVSFTVRPGEVLGVLGPNSAGKTTLLRLLSRVLLPAHGTIRLDGHDLASMSRVDVARRIAVVPQDVAVAFPFTARELVLMGRFPHGPRRFFENAGDRRAAESALARAGVTGLAERLIPDLSGGERQLVLVARALAQQPLLLLMDEPNAHLDLRHQVELVRLVRHLNREAGTTIVLVSHDLSLAGELCDRLVLLARGRVARLGVPDAVLVPDLIEDVYGCPVTVEADPKTGRPRVHVRWVDDEARARREDR